MLKKSLSISRSLICVLALLGASSAKADSVHEWLDWKTGELVDPETQFDLYDEPPVENLTLDAVLFQLHGKDYLQPSKESLLGKYIAETGAQTITRKFWRAPDGSRLPPHELGPARLIVPVSQATFPLFKKYFSSIHFLHLLHEHGNRVAFEGMRSGGDNWSGQNLDVEFQFPGNGKITSPMILSSSEGLRAKKYFQLARLFPGQYRDQSNLARYPWYLRGAERGAYCGAGAWATGCGTWIGNMPIGDELVDEYYFPAGDADGDGAIHPKLQNYVTKDLNLKPETEALLREVWTVPGHKQLAEILDKGANRRGEFENAGWTSITFLGSASPKRVPVVFLFVDDVKKKPDPEFYYSVDGAW